VPKDLPPPRGTPRSGMSLISRQRLPPFRESRARSLRQDGQRLGPTWVILLIRQSRLPPTVADETSSSTGGGARSWLHRERFVVSLTAVLIAVVAAISTPVMASVTRQSTWSRAVTGICAHALLFEGRHEIGARAGAVAVARDIRASTARRLRRIRALQIPPPDQRLSGRWLRLERRLADREGKE
jgi:hypothetical protein